ncbi:MAG TPA: IPT/TIG domain-containing protein, partial [Methylomirabilota bacterium]|nr:IPT/TIG domain-containing protein [Methylomirabilota bacterium]
MRSFLHCLVLVGLVALVACSGDSPKAPAVPTVVPDAWTITALTVTDSNPFVNTAIGVTATITKNGEPAPDGTIVEFVATGGVFLSSSGLEASVATDGGEATAIFGATSAGSYTIQAQVRGVSRQIQVVYRERNASDALQIWNVNPSSGSYAGGETVVLTGKGIRAPAEVYLTVQGVEYQAIVDGVVDSMPLSSAGTITIRTPKPTAATTTITSPANVRVVVGVGTGNQEEQTLPSAFTYLGYVDPGPGEIPTPVIFGVEPYYGRSRGGELVTILGSGFVYDDEGLKARGATKELQRNFTNVYFTFRGQQLLAQVERYSANQIEVVTPRFSLTPLAEDENAGILLTRPDGDVQRDNLFIVLADIAQPEITGISPTAGPLDGGTVVTITGHGFEVPVQVRFGTLEATGVQVIDDPSVNDNDVITCVTPDYTRQGVTPPFATTVTVTNLSTGNSATSSQTFTFGDGLYVGQASPTQGQIGDLLTLFGAGFEDPLTVWFRPGGAEIEFEVISVTGTQITLRSPPELAPTCNDRSGDFRVVLTDGNLEATGGDYTLLGSNPTVTSVDPIFVYETANGNGVDPSEIDIYGVRFAPSLLVLIDDYTMNPGSVTVESPEHIHVTGIPAPNTFNLVFDTTACTTPGGLPGIKNVPTPVDVTVRNLPLGCQNTLAQTLVYVPQDQSCVVAPNLAVSLGAFDPTPAGTCSPPVSLLLTNSGGGDLDIQSLTLQGRFFFQQGFNQNAGPLTIPAFGSNNSLDVYFCPDVDTNATYNGQLVIISNDPNSPEFVPLSATELDEPEITTAPVGPGGTWTFPDTASGAS